METSGPTSGIPRVAAGSAGTTSGQWQVGQLLQATVTDSGIGKVLLAIGNRQVSAETSLPLHKGQQLSLEVRSLGQLPVLRLNTAISESPTATAARLLLPRQGSLTPLLANLNQLAQAANPPVPPLLKQLVQSMVKEMPDVATVSSPRQLKKAIENSGIFLEPRLSRSAAQSGAGLSIHSDFKANLLKLVQLVRNWPGSSGQPPATAATGTTATGGTPAAVGAVTTAQTTSSSSAGAATPGQLGRAVLTTATARSVTGTPQQPVATGLTSPTATAPAGVSAQPQALLQALVPPPPLPGTVPVPQATVVSSLDLVNRLGNLRTDLLKQIEAALARTQLQQLATMPREDGDRTLLEWLLEVPVRRGDDIDLWSLRIFREAEDSRRERSKQAQRWTVQLAFDLPGLGPMQVHISLTGEQVSTRFWATQEQTLPLVREHLHELRQALLDAGLEVGDLECQTGSAPAGKPGTGAPLISEKA